MDGLPRGSRVGFRVDSSPGLGMGHLSRCLSLASALRTDGVRSVFLLGGHDDRSAELVRRQGHDVDVLPAGDDARETAARLLSRAVDAIVIDHYGLDAVWERRVADTVRAPVIVINGLADRAHACDVLVDPTHRTSNPDRWRGLVPDKAFILHGPRFAPVGPEFAAALAERSARDGTIDRLLIAFGGSDLPGMTLRALEAVLSASSGLRVDVVVGRNNPAVRDIAARCGQSDEVRFHYDSDEIARLMANADLALGAGGAMMWERIFLGLPAVVVAIADHQREIASEVEAAGAIDYLGAANEVSRDDLSRAIETLRGQPDRVREMAERARALVEHDRQPGSVRLARTLSQALGRKGEEGTGVLT